MSEPARNDVQTPQMGTFFPGGRWVIWKPLIFLVVGVLLLTASAYSRDNPLVQTASKYNLEIAASTVAIYASLRGINAVLSLVQEAEVSGGAIVVSGTTQPLKVLEPIDDTVERIATLVLGVAITSGLLGIMLEPASFIGMVLAGFGLIGLATFRLFTPGRNPGSHPLTHAIERISTVAVRLGLVFFLLIPGSYALAFWAGEHWTEREWREANATLADVTTVIQTSNDTATAEGDDPGNPNAASPPSSKTDLQSLTPASTETPSSTETLASPPKTDALTDNQSILSRMISGISQVISDSQNYVNDTAAEAERRAKRMFSGIGDFSTMVSKIGEKANDLFTSTISILVVYLLKLIVLPLMLIFVFTRLLRAAWE